QEICFVAQNDYRGFIDRYAKAQHDGLAERQAPQPVYAGVAAQARSGGVIQIPRPGLIVDTAGKTLGRHRGLAYYTIGQRKGLGLTSTEPLHVLKIDAEQNALVVGPAEALLRSSCIVG